MTVENIHLGGVNSLSVTSLLQLHFLFKAGFLQLFHPVFENLVGPRTVRSLVVDFQEPEEVLVVLDDLVLELVKEELQVGKSAHEVNVSHFFKLVLTLSRQGWTVAGNSWVKRR